MRAAKIPMELGTERTASPGESEAPNSELQWVRWLRKQLVGTYLLAQGEPHRYYSTEMGFLILLHAIHLSAVE